MSTIYYGVPRLGIVKMSTHAFRKMRKEGISEELFEEVLFFGIDKENRSEIGEVASKIVREKNNIRIVLTMRYDNEPATKDNPNTVVTVYRRKHSHERFKIHKINKQRNRR